MLLERVKLKEIGGAADGNNLNAAGLERNIIMKKKKILRMRIRTIRDQIILSAWRQMYIIDSKVSLVAYVNYYNVEEKEDKKYYLKEHLIYQYPCNYLSKQKLSGFRQNQPIIY